MPVKSLDPEIAAVARMNGTKRGGEAMRAVYWVEGEPYYAHQLAEKTGRNKDALTAHVSKLRKRGEQLTWANLKMR